MDYRATDKTLMRKTIVSGAIIGGAIFFGLASLLLQQPRQKASGPAVARQVVVVSNPGFLERYGVNKDDIILEINGDAATATMFQKLGARVSAGEEVRLLIYRITDGKAKRLSIQKDRQVRLWDEEGEDYEMCNGTSGLGCSANNLCQSADSSRCIITTSGNCADCMETDCKECD